MTLSAPFSALPNYSRPAGESARNGYGGSIGIENLTGSASWALKDPPTVSLAPRMDIPYTGVVLTRRLSLLLLALCLEAGQLSACAPQATHTLMAPSQNPEPIYADVLSVSVSGEPGAYQFNVEIASPDSGCENYADWWEVVSNDGRLVYRRILLHSHADEQPFTRSGGPLPVNPDDVLWVRAHMNTTGYGGQALRGSLRGGFVPAELGPARFSDLELAPPQPDGCAF